VQPGDHQVLFQYRKRPAAIDNPGYVDDVGVPVPVREVKFNPPRRAGPSCTEPEEPGVTGMRGARIGSYILARNAYRQWESLTGPGSQFGRDDRRDAGTPTTDSPRLSPDDEAI
jgi:hypothetical protein